MIIIYIIVLLILWYLNILALTASLGTTIKGGTLKFIFIVVISLVISIVDFYIPTIILVAIILVILGKIKKII